MTVTSPTLLYIDDDAALARLVERGLTRLGFTVVHASSGQHGLERLQQGGIDVIALDQYMPGFDGLETLERILAPDFVHPVAAGVFLTKQQHIAWAVEHQPGTRRKRAFEELHVRIYGSSAIATGIVANSDGSGGDLQRTIFADVFLRRSGRWKAVSAQETPITGAHERPPFRQ